MLVLAGVTVGAFFTALQTFVQQHSVQNLQEIYSFILGGIATASWHDVALVSPYVVVSAVVMLMHARVLDALALGDMEASSLGVNVRRTRLIVVVAATVGTAAVVSVSGLIGFVGIIVRTACGSSCAPAACACCCRSRSCSAPRSSCSAISPRARSSRPPSCRSA